MDEDRIGSDLFRKKRFIFGGRVRGTSHNSCGHDENNSPQSWFFLFTAVIPVPL
jgi:hypothetical protein